MLKLSPRIIKTLRLLLKEISDNDKEKMLYLFDHPDVYKTYMIPNFETHEQKIELFNTFKNI